MLMRTLTAIGKTRASLDDFIDWQRRNIVLVQLAALSNQYYNVPEVEEPERTYGLAVSRSLFLPLNIQPAGPRFFLKRKPIAICG